MLKMTHLSLLMAFVLAFTSISHVKATCTISGMAAHFGTAPNSYNFTQKEIFEEYWAWNGSPSPSSSTERTDTCRASCSSNVVINTAMETVWNVFYIAINGRYLLNDYTWSAAPSTVPISSFSSSKPWNAMLIGIDTPIALNSNTKFFTGKYRMGKIVEGGQYQPIYQIPFPYWACQTVPVQGRYNQKNYIQIANTIPKVNGPDGHSALCGLNSYTALSFTVKRTCSSTVVGDPQFVGLRGQSYQVHGIDGGVYNLISTPDHSVTSRFVWLDGPRACPVIPSTGQPAVGCWTHTGSYLDNIGVRGVSGAQLLIESGPAGSGLKDVSLNGVPMKVGESKILDKEGLEWVHYNSSHEVTLNVGVFTIEVENSDGFVNLRKVTVKGMDWIKLRNDDTHGLLGQTWRSTDAKKAVEGRVDDYLVESGDVFDTDFVYSRYRFADE